jgi:hypothetical protein
VSSALFAAAPFGFALIRAVRTGNDFRYLWVALASFAGMAAVMMVKANTRKPGAGAWLPAASFVVSTLLAVLMAVLLGTTLGPGILMVASAFGFCCAVSGGLWARA